MTLAEAMLRLEEGSSSEVLKQFRGAPGVSSAYFDRLLEIYGADPGRALKLASHWRTILRHGDDPALAYRAKGAADRLRANWLASARAFLRAGDFAVDERNRLSYAAGAIDGFAKAGRIDEALNLGIRLSTGLDQLGEKGLAARIRLNTGNALLAADRNREARMWFERAIPEFEGTRMPLEQVAATLGLSSTHLYGGDPSGAKRLAETARTQAFQLDLDYTAALCDLNIAQAALVIGEPENALAALLEAKSRLAGAPTDLARVDEFLGDAYLRLNLNREAADAYASAMSAKRYLPALNRADVELGLGQSLAERDPFQADRHFRNASTAFEKLGNRPWKSAVLSSRARLLLPKYPAQAAKIAAQAMKLSKEAPYHRVEALLVRAEALLAHGSPFQEEVREASALIQRFGFAQSRWRVEYLKARSASKPLPAYRRMLRTILAARLATSSVVARFNFLADKTEALSRYLEVLLRNPSKADVAEAIEVIAQTRSITLLDEMLASGTVVRTPQQLADLEELRKDLKQEEVAFRSSPDSRRASMIDASSRSRRRWTEITHALGLLQTPAPQDHSQSSFVFAEVGDLIYVLHEDAAFRLPIRVSELSKTLRWLHFELAAPMADREASSQASLDMFTDLAARLVLPWADRAADVLYLSPDSHLWDVPWQGLFAVAGVKAEPVICLHPTLTSLDIPKVIERVCIWVDRPDDLPHSGKELASVLEAFPEAAVCTMVQAARESLEEEWDLVHVIGHARHNPENPMFSYIEFPDGVLHAAEIARSPANVRMAYLSACDTGAMSLSVRQEPDGLARAFLAGRAGAVIASLWSLDDEAASVFAKIVYSSLQKGYDLAQSIGIARAFVRDWRGHPYFWAPFTLFGGYRK